ncbi:MAG: extracellular solute-binding protein [Pseudomonadota bacterium]
MISTKGRDSSQTRVCIADGSVRRNRRRALKSIGLMGAAGLCAPAIVNDALSSSGQLHVICWEGYLPKSFRDQFENTTGIKVRYTSLGSNEELLSKLQASKGQGFDLIAPTLNRKGQWQPLGLLQPWNLKRVYNLQNCEQTYIDASKSWFWDGGQYHLPHIWGTEAVAYRTDYWIASRQVSFGDLWLPEFEGRVTGRPHSMLAGVARYLANIGRAPDFKDAYLGPEQAEEIWQITVKFAIEKKSWVKDFWNDHTAQKLHFTHGGIAIGQTWDGPIIELKKGGVPVNYVAPIEGAFAWLDGLALPIGAKNLEQAYEFVNEIYTLDAAVQMATASGYNATVRDVASHLDDTARRIFEEAYHGDALEKLWWWPDEPQWFAQIRNKYRDIYLTA